MSDRLHNMQTEIKIMEPRMARYSKIAKYMKRIDKNGQYSNFGQLEGELRNRLKNFIGDEKIHVSTCSSASIGIAGLTALLSSRDNKEWVVPSWTFTATPAAVYFSGSSFKFCDVEIETMAIGKKILESDDNKIAVAPFGSKIEPFINSNFKGNLIVDAAASFGALQNITLKNRDDWACVVSLHSTKNLGAGEGGFIFSKNEDLVRDFRKWINFGFSESRNSVTLGFNGKLSEYNCAVALANLDEWSQNERLLTKLSKKELELHQKYGFHSLEVLNQNIATPYWIIRVNHPNERKLLENIFTKNNVQLRHWWSNGCHTMPAYLEAARIDSLENTKVLSELTIGLPHHANLDHRQFKKISNLLKEVYCEIDAVQN